MNNQELQERYKDIQKLLEVANNTLRIATALTMNVRPTMMHELDDICDNLYWIIEEVKEENILCYNN